MIRNFLFPLYQQQRCITYLIYCIIALYNVNNLCAQTDSWHNFIEQLSTEDRIEQPGWNDYLEELTYRHDHPTNINTATREDFSSLGLLSHSQIDALLIHIYHYGGFRSEGEWKLLPELGWYEQEILKLFFYVGTIPQKEQKLRLKDLLKSGKHTLLTSVDIPLYQRDGYKTHTQEELLKNPNQIYLGQAFAHRLRYAYDYNNRLQFGMNMEKDSGEPWGQWENKGYDSYGFHFLYRSKPNKNGVNTIALGDYRLAWGEGLVMNNAFLPGKAFQSTTREALRAKTSTDEENFLRGAAFRLKFKTWNLTPFYSFRRRDATLDKYQQITTLRTTGYHRTWNEIEHKNNVNEHLIGGHLAWNNTHWQLGATGYHQIFNRPFTRGTAAYRQGYPLGKQFSVFGLNYAYNGYRWQASGETAISWPTQGIACLHKASYRLNSDYKFLLLHRYYAADYHAFYSQALCENSALRNEHGLYMAVEARPLTYLQCNGYLDVFHHHAPKYGVNEPSTGMEGMLQSIYTPSKQWKYTLRYQAQNKVKYQIRNYDHTVKISALCSLHKLFSINSHAQWHYHNNVYNQKSNGWGWMEHFQFLSPTKRYSLKLSTGYFQSDDYDSRIYFYEPGLLYSFSYPARFGKGLRNALVIRIQCKHWMLAMKGSITHRFDVKEQGSGPARIDSPTQSDLQIQLRIRY